MNVVVNLSVLLPSIITANTLRRMRWAGHEAHTGRGHVHTVFWLGDLRERDNLKDPDVDGRIILK